MTLEELNTICMQMISYAGEGRSIVYDAMSELLNNKYEEADKKLCEAEKILGEAHRLQFEDLMVAQSRSEDIPFEYSGVAEPYFPLKKPPIIPMGRANLSANKSQ